MKKNQSRNRFFAHPREPPRSKPRPRPRPRPLTFADSGEGTQYSYIEYQVPSPVGKCC